MQQRRVRLGDILDDYCPRERRITNHAVVAMIEDEVKQTRCTTCDADHEYKQAKVPASRRKKPEASLVAARPPVFDPEAPIVDEELVATPLDELETETVDAAMDVAMPEPEAVAGESEPEPESSEPSEAGEADPADDRDEWPVHRPLIRATLPRPEGQTPERKAPDFTIRQNGRFDNRNGNNRHRGQRQAQGQGQGQSRFGNSRSGGQGQGGHGQRHSNRQGGPSGGGGQRGGGRPPGHGGRGQGRGPKRGR